MEYTIQLFCQKQPLVSFLVRVLLYLLKYKMYERISQHRKYDQLRADSSVAIRKRMLHLSL